MEENLSGNDAKVLDLPPRRAVGVNAFRMGVHALRVNLEWSPRMLSLMQPSPLPSDGEQEGGQN